TFRQDLYYRFNVLRVSLPPLRERQDDIPLLIERLLEKICRTTNKAQPIISDKVLKIFSCYHWPGNVRELENILQRLVVLKAGSCVYPEDIGEIKEKSIEKLHDEDIYKGTAIELKGNLEDMEKAIISTTLKLTGNDKEKTCEKLGISQTTLWRRLKKWNIAE
ncbi:MAG: helix-turn-helix domain-containing protein, partial [Tepidanaerobacteraceae bacterium]|nr:helix-turn-helix domain-containing protein [Tepidanaerobacteraceae bacterium]